MNSLARLKAIIGGDGYHLCILNDTSKLHDLIDLKLIKQPIKRLHQFAYDNSRQLILVSQKERTDYLTIEEMKRNKKILWRIHKKSGDYDKIVILYYLEHPALVNNEAFFPVTLINKQNGWKIHHIHNVDVNKIDIDYCEENNLFQSFSYCLYDKKHYKSVELVNVNNNIHKLKIIPKFNILDQRDIIKYDSIKKIQRAVENEQMIYSILASELTYKRRGSFILKGEHTGAMSICADRYDYASLEKKLKTIKDDKQIEALFSAIFKSFDSLYKLHDSSKPYDLNAPSKSVLELYMKNILSVVLEIVSLEIPFEPADDDESLSILPWKDLFNNSCPKNNLICELIDIIPDFSDINQFKLVFGLNVSINNKTISCCASRTESMDDWREVLNTEGIQTGKKYKLKVKFDNFLSPYFDAITDLILYYNATPSLTIDEEYKKLYRNTLMKKETVQIGKDIYANPGSILQDTKKMLQKLIKDQSKLVYGNANLNTIEFFEKSENLKKSAKGDDLKTIHPFFSDLSSIGTNYPASFDMAKLEFEIKNHIIANHILSDCYRKNTRQWISLLFCIEQDLQSETVNTKLYQDIEKIDPETQARIKQMIFLIRKIRKKAFKIYKRGSEKQSEFKNEVVRRYLQQLLFCSLDTLTNKDIEDPSRFHATISAIYTTTELFSEKEFTFYSPEPPDIIDKNEFYISNHQKNKKCFNKYQHGNQENHTDKSNIALKKDISIFLASSKELQTERDCIDLLIAKMNRSLHKKGLFLNLIKWEEQNAAFNKTRKQEDFNKIMLTCDVVIVLFYQKVGKFTHEEFRRAYESLKHGNKPSYLFVYFKKFDYSEASQSDLTQILELQREIEGYDQFHKFFSSVDDLKYDIQSQLDLIVNLSPLTIINQINNKEYGIFTQVDIPFDIIEQIEKVYDAQNGNNQFFKLINDLYYGEAKNNQSLSDAMYHIIMNYFYNYKLIKKEQK